MTESYGVPDRTMEQDEFRTVAGSLVPEKAERMEFSKIENDKFVLEYGDKDGKAIFHLFASSTNSGVWGREFAPVIKKVLEDVFADGEMEWIPEAHSWFFRPTRTPIDYKIAATMLLAKLLEQG